MAQTDPMDDYQKAIDRLAELTSAVASQRSQIDVLDALVQLRLAVIRAYGGTRPRQAQGQGAQKRILNYLLEHLGEFVYGDELAAVSGIGEWARRVRELRVEEGYEIEEDAGRYRLRARDPNAERRARWQTVTELRDVPGTGIDRVRLVLERLAPHAVTVDELDRVARAKEGARHARELRSRDLMPVEASSDTPDLRAGEYRLASPLEQDVLHLSQRLFNEELREQVFKRDHYRCWTCQRDRTAAQPSAATPFFLVVRHLDLAPDALLAAPVSRVNDLSRLATSCNKCAGSAPG